MDLPHPREECGQLGRRNIASPDFRSGQVRERNQKMKMGEREGGQEENLSKSDKWGKTRWWFSYQIIVADAADAVSVNFSGRCKFLQI